MKHSKFKVLTIAFVIACLGIAGLFYMQQSKLDKKPKNIIFLVGDGMGVSYTSAYSYFMNNENRGGGQNTTFDDYLVGQQATFPLDPKDNITDSASAATAMATGVKTYNNAISVDNNKEKLKTVVEDAKELGKSTGLVATSEVTHATPGAYGAHDVSRKNMDAIADNFFDERIGENHKIDVLLGGGSGNFVRPDRDLTQDFIKDGYSFVSNKSELVADKNDKVLGLFAPKGLPSTIDREDSIPSLSDMTSAAINRLKKNKQGFFLMVEGSQIDWGGHNNDVVEVMSEMKDFDAALKTAIDFAREDKNTLVVTTADHSTGGMTIGANGAGSWNSNVIKDVKKTPNFIAKTALKNNNLENTLREYVNFEFTAEELAAMQIPLTQNSDDSVEAIASLIRKAVDKRTNTGWTTGGHTGEDVNTYAYGVQSELFRGRIDNTDQGKLIKKLLGAKDAKH